MRSLQIFGLLALMLTPLAASAESSTKGVSRVDLLPGWQMADGSHMAALRITLEPGWKTYWRAPGDAGIPPSFDWRGSQNVSGIAFHWPSPTVFELGGTRTIGYVGELVLPIQLFAENPAAPIHLQGAIDLGVCHDICLPVSLRVETQIAPAPSGPEDQTIRAALNARPMTGAEAGVSAARCVVDPISDGLRITTQIDMPSLGADEVMVVEHPDAMIWVSPSTNARAGGTLTSSADMVPPTAAPFALDRSSLRITVLAGGRAVEFQGCARG